ncbi:ubiquinone/menaquinone biosynthesis methyltransferase [bacterium]|nr:ubiquinone/menaquinone biosynthesis methyltransferase [bacterium]
MNKSPEKIKEMFNQIAKNYDSNNNLISFGLHKYIKKKAIENFEFSGKCLDLCTGTGDIAYLLKNKCDVTGFDFSENMLKIAREKHPDINFIEGDCTNLPFEDNSFDSVAISFGLRNIEDYNKALDEIARVLKPDGIFFHLDFGKKNFLANFIFDYFIPILVKIFYGNDLPYKYLVQSKKLFFNEKELQNLFEKHKFEVLKNKSFLFGTISCQYCKNIK